MTEQMRRACADLANRVLLADSIGQALEAAAGENAPPWVYVFRDQIEAIREASELVECLANRGQHAAA